MSVTFQSNNGCFGEGTPKLGPMTTALPFGPVPDSVLTAAIAYTAAFEASRASYFIQSVYLPLSASKMLAYFLGVTYDAVYCV